MVTERVVPVYKKVFQEVEEFVDVPVYIPREPVVEVEEGKFIPLSEWKLLEQATLERDEDREGNHQWVNVFAFQ